MGVTYETPKILLYTRIKKGPFYRASRRHGVKAYSVYNHRYHPRYYDDPINEYWKLIEGVTLWDVGVERQIEITGADAFEFTNFLVPRDLTKCKVGQCKYTVLCAEDGGIINDPVLLRLGENHFWLSLADSDVELWARGLAYFSGFDVHIEEADVGPVQIQGPNSKDVVRDLFGEQVLQVPYYHLWETKLEDMDVVVSRTGYTGEVGYEIYLKNASQDAIKLWDTILDAGEPYEMAVTGPNHIRRVEAGMLSYGADMDLNTNPFEVGLDWMVNLDQQADFVGKESLRRIREQGISRRLVGVEIRYDPILDFIEDYWRVSLRQEGETVGYVTSAFYSPRLEKNIGYAMLPTEYTEPGTKLVVRTEAGETTAKVVEKPFIDPKKDIPKK